MSKSGFTKLIIYNALGREISTLVSGMLNEGTYEIDWNGANYPSGLYFYRLEVTDPLTSLRAYDTKKMILIK
jgi:hypothetical protein